MEEMRVLIKSIDLHVDANIW